MSVGDRALTNVEKTVGSVLEHVPESLRPPEWFCKWAFIIPAFLFYVPFLVFPAVAVFALSLFKWDGLGSLTFVGFENYARALGSSVVHISLWHNFVVAGLSILLQVVFGLVVALAIRAGHKKLRAFYQGALLVPMTLMAVGVSLVWAYIYNPAYGVLNSLLTSLGWEQPPLWLGDPSIALVSIVVVATWQWTGFRVVLWLAGLDSIDKRYYEAAKMDGAGRLATFRYITLPQLRPVALFIMVYTIIGSFRSFAYFWVMTRGGPGHATEVMVTWIYKTAFFQSNFGGAAAISVLLFVVTLLLSVLNFTFGEEGGIGR